MKYLLIMLISTLMTACQNTTSSDQAVGLLAKKPLAYCQGVYNNNTPFEVLISQYGDGSVVTEPSPGYLAPGEYKGFIDLYVDDGIVIIRNLEQITADKPVTGSCQIY